MVAQPVKVGGQALGDGVLMRTDRAWAIARADGSVERGAVRRTWAARVPVLRVLAGLAGALRLTVGRGLLGRGRRPGSTAAVSRRFLWVLLAVEAVALALSVLLDSVTSSGASSMAATVAPWIATFAVLRLAVPGVLWRYHGAEHKAVAAHEAGVDPADLEAVLRSPRVHDRCGTNLVFLLMVCSVPLASLPGLVQLPALLVVLAAAAEVVSLAARRPGALASRAVLAGGRSLQRWVTTAEPAPAEQQVACLALTACLREHARAVAGGQLASPVPVAA